MELILYGLPLLVFLIICMIMYKNNEKEEVNYIKILLPGIVITVLVFLIIKYKENVSEPMMNGNYFD